MNRIKETLIEAGISQTELAKRLGKGFNMVNLYASNEIYVSDEYSYRYSGSNWVLTSWNARWPTEFGTGYEERSYPEYEKYTWDGNRFTTVVWGTPGYLVKRLPSISKCWGRVDN